VLLAQVLTSAQTADKLGRFDDVLGLESLETGRGVLSVSSGVSSGMSSGVSSGVSPGVSSVGRGRDFRGLRYGASFVGGLTPFTW
jgi:hypothetical protein